MPGFRRISGGRSWRSGRLGRGRRHKFCDRFFLCRSWLWLRSRLWFGSWLRFWGGLRFGRGNRSWRRLGLGSLGKINFVSRERSPGKNVGDEERRIFQRCHAQGCGFHPLAHGEISFPRDHGGNRGGLHQDKILRGIDHADHSGPLGKSGGGGSFFLGEQSRDLGHTCLEKRRLRRLGHGGDIGRVPLLLLLSGTRSEPDCHNHQKKKQPQRPWGSGDLQKKVDHNCIPLVEQGRHFKLCDQSHVHHSGKKQSLSPFGRGSRLDRTEPRKSAGRLFRKPTENLRLLAKNQASTSRTVNFFGPWAPRTRMRSMSPVLLGPVMKETNAGGAP